jgi:DNA-binding GntR family transcriptional regulator
MLSLNERLWYYFLPQLGEPRKSPADHRQIFASLQARDREKAAEQMAEHIQSMQDRLQAVLLGQDNNL